MEHITLYYKEGSSDKVYSVRIEPKDSGYVVNFAYGRRGSTMTTGTKTSTAVDYDAAKAIYDKLVKEKTSKGYTPGEDGTPYQHTAKASTGIHCQLLNSIGDDEIEKLISDPSWWMQEKKDGRRLLLKKEGDSITGINRLGLIAGISVALARDALRCVEDFVLDGEGIGDHLHVFDAVLIGDEEIGGCRYTERYLRLMNLLGSFQHPHIHLVSTAFSANDKQELFDKLKDKNAEGVVFKHSDAPYIAGRPSSGGTQLKHKFCETASFIVGSVNSKRSVKLKLLNGKSFVDAGNVTIPPNHDIPKPGTVVEVRYLYAFKESGCIYQPVYLGARDDIDPAECMVAQLKYKADQPQEALV
ncbi:MAG: WGR domain-containing protein [Chthoniobacteraceae bacterium]